MRTPPPIRLVLFDFDGVLVRYAYRARLASLARVAGCTPQRVSEALFDSGLERAYDSGTIDTTTYLQRLGARIGATIDAAAWIEARVAGTQADPAVCALAASLGARVELGVLTNNGALLLDAIPRIVASLFPMLDDRVLCSGVLGTRKPDRAIFERALAHFDTPAREALFLDDLFVNVQGARDAGLHADTVGDARSLRRVLRRYGLL